MSLTILPVFPGGYLPSFNFVVETLNKGSAGRLVVDSVLNIGPHYARTLREWKRKFLENWDGVIAKALVEQYNLDAESLEIFKRKWICACSSISHCRFNQLIPNRLFVRFLNSSGGDR